MLVIVGSDNPVKIKAVENVFKAWYGECEIIGRHVETGLPGQPLDLSQTLRARNGDDVLPFLIPFQNLRGKLLQLPVKTSVLIYLPHILKNIYI